MIEVWRPVKGYEGLYEVSNFGRVNRFNWRQTGKEKLMTPRPNGRGYYTVTLTKEKRSITKYVHRLVAEAFLPNPNNYPQVNHKDEDKTNNFVYVNEDGTVDLEKSNLEWCTQQYNLEYGTGRKRRGTTYSKGYLRSGDLLKYRLFMSNRVNYWRYDDLL